MKRLLGLAGLVLLAVSCRSGAPAVAVDGDSPRHGGTEVIGTITDVDSWNEYLSRQSFAHGLLRRMYPGLARDTGDGTGDPDDFVAALAESWSFSVDGLELSFELHDWRWSDGQPVGAEDVRFTWSAQTSEHVPWINAETKRRIVDVRVDGPRTVTFVFDQRYPFQFADAVEGGILPAHVFGAVPFEEWATHDWSTAAVVSGPFRLADHRAGQEIVLERNERYGGERPYLDRVVVRVVPDIANLVTQLRSGDIDYLDGVSPRDGQRLTGDARLTLIPFDRPGYDFLGWNGARAPFDQPEMRRAMTLAIDRQALVEDLLYGYGRVSRGPLLSFWRGAGTAPAAWSHDADEARRILRARGYRTLDRQGNETPGEVLRFELMTNAGNRLREEMLVKIQAQLATIGVEVEVATVEMRTLRQRAAAGEYDGYLGGWVYSVKDLRQVFGSEYRFPRGANVVAYESGEVDRLFARIDAARDWMTMEPLLTEVQAQIHQDQPYTFLYESKRLAVHGPRLGGVSIDSPSDPLAHVERAWRR